MSCKHRVCEIIGHSGMGEESGTRGSQTNSQFLRMIGNKPGEMFGKRESKIVSSLELL